MTTPEKMRALLKMKEGSVYSPKAIARRREEDLRMDTAPAATLIS